ncbi:MAG: inositol monophosphatase family protein [Desulfobulbus sp.]|nr:inositol monophosphatase family protein [Desulfobulbus sp.]
MHRISTALNRCATITRAQMLTTACQAALTAGKLIKDRYNQPHDIAMKGAINLVTETDLAAEAAILACLAQDAPEIPVMAEESASTHQLTDAHPIWIVDPLDGTTNFAHGFPHFAVSIALVDSGRPLVAAIYQPMLDELFCASQRGGAWLNGCPIRVSAADQLINALIGTGFPYEVEHTLPDVMRQLTAMLPKVRDIRRAGAAALDLAYVACGRLDGFYEMNLQPWDTAAGWLLVEEAGGRLSDFSGAPFSPFVPQTLASNGRLHQALLQLL